MAKIIFVSKTTDYLQQTGENYFWNYFAKPQETHNL